MMLRCEENIEIIDLSIACVVCNVGTLHLTDMFISILCYKNDSLFWFAPALHVEHFKNT